ncbi:hypothetical protein ScPMuIL_012958 [Solemya velum]
MDGHSLWIYALSRQTEAGSEVYYADIRQNALRFALCMRCYRMILRCYSWALRENGVFRQKKWVVCGDGHVSYWSQAMDFLKVLEVRTIVSSDNWEFEIEVSWTVPVLHKFVKNYMLWWSPDTYKPGYHDRSWDRMDVGKTNSKTIPNMWPSSTYEIWVVSVEDTSRPDKQEVSSEIVKQHTRPQIPRNMQIYDNDRNVPNITFHWGNWRFLPDEILNITVSECTDHWSVIPGQERAFSLDLDDYNWGWYLTGMKHAQKFLLTAQAISEGLFSHTETHKFSTNPTAPGPIMNLECAVVQRTSITLSWESLTHTGYHVTYHIDVHNKKSGYGFKTQSYYTEIQRHNIFRVGQLSSATHYRLTVSVAHSYLAINSATVDCYTDYSYGQAAPRSFGATNVTSREASLSWLPPNRFSSFVLAVGDNDYDPYHCIGWIVLKCDTCVAPSKGWDKLCKGDHLEVRLLTFNSEPGSETAIAFGTTQEVPQVPYDILVGKITASSMNLTWQIDGPFPGPTTYTVFIYKVFDGTKQVVKHERIKGFENRKKVIMGLEENTEYEFSVNASTVVGFSQAGNSSRYRTLHASAAPRNLIVTNVTNRNATLSWSLPENTDGLVIGYTINVTATGNSTNLQTIYFQCFTCTVPQFSNNGNWSMEYIFEDYLRDPSYTMMYTLKKLVPYFNYTAHVFVIDRAGAGHWAEAIFQTKEEAPQAPQSVYFVSITSDSMLLAWTMEGPQPGNTTYTVSVYEFSQNQTKQFVKTEDIQGFENQHLNITDLKVHRVWIPTERTSTIECNPPEDLTVINVTSRQAVLSWKLPNNTHGTVDSYRVMVFARNRVGEGRAAKAEFNTEEDIPQTPFDITVTDITADSMVLHWYVDTYHQPGNTTWTITIYKVSGETKQFVRHEEVMLDSLNPVIGGLEEGTDYEFSIVASTAAGSSDIGNSTRYTTLFHVLEAPTDLAVTNVTSRMAMVSWKLPNNSHGHIDSYTLIVKKAWGYPTCQMIVFSCNTCNYTSPSDRQSPGTSCQNKYNEILDIDDLRNSSYTVEYTVAGLDAYLNYTVKVFGSNSGGKGQDAKAGFKTKQEVPLVPNNIRVEDITADSMKVTWKPGGPTVGEINYSVIVYEISGGIENVLKKEENQGVSNVAKVITGLKSFTEYMFSVSASTAAGSSDAGNSSVYRTLLEALEAPRNLTITNVTSRQAVLSWKPPINSHGNVAIPPSLQAPGVEVLFIPDDPKTTQTSFQLIIVDTFYLDHTNGKITDSGLIVCAKCNDNEALTLSMHRTWRQAKQAGFQSYRATNDTWLSELKTDVDTQAKMWISVLKVYTLPCYLSPCF